MLMGIDGWPRLHQFWIQGHIDTIKNYLSFYHSRGAVALSVERPSKVPVWCNSTDMGLNPGAAT